MQDAVQAPSEYGTVEATITIERKIEDVFAFYRDFRNLPLFLGDVMAVERIDCATYRWTIEGPLGIRGWWTTTVTDERPNSLIRYHAAGAGTSWEIHFDRGPVAASTNVREVMKMPFGMLGRVALALVGEDPAAEVAANLHRLKQVMETGRVTDTSHAVPGKFEIR